MCPERVRTGPHELANIDLGGDAIILRRAIEPLLIERRLAMDANHGFVRRQHANPRPHRVIELRGGKRLAKLAIPVGVTSPLEGQHGNVMHFEVVGVRVSGLVIAISNQYLRAFATDQSDKPPGGLIEVSLMKAVGVIVGLRVGHSRIAITEHLNLIKADHRSRRGQLRRSQRSDFDPFLLGRQAVKRLALLA